MLHHTLLRNVSQEERTAGGEGAAGVEGHGVDGVHHVLALLRLSMALERVLAPLQCSNTMVKKGVQPAISKRFGPWSHEAEHISRQVCAFR